MLNQITIAGRLTRDPELRHTANGTAVASFALAVDRDYTSKDGGERETDFVAALTALHPDSDESTVDLFCLAAELDRYADIGRNIKAFMGDAGTGACDRFKVSWKTQARRTFDSKRFASDHPDMDLSGYYKESTARAFRVMETKGE